MKILSIFGTRPEAIKMAPVLLALRDKEKLSSKVLLTGQHRDLVAPALATFGLHADRDLALMEEGQSLAGFHAKALRAIADRLEHDRPDWVLVHGDTASALAAATAAFYAGIPIAHVEAGLRTGDVATPFPEEMNRRTIAIMSKLHFAPTMRARDALLVEGVSARSIVVTGNTAVDAVLQMARDLAPFEVETGKKLVLVTGHRRENVGKGLDGICKALRHLARRSDVTILFPVHPNPAVKGPVAAQLANIDNLWLVDPFDYSGMVAAMKSAYLILTDSGGIQEEAAALGVPTIVMRDVTERPEAVQAGCAMIGGTEPRRLAAIASNLLDDCRFHRSMAVAPCPFGDGRAGQRIAAHLDAQSPSQSTMARNSPSVSLFRSIRGTRSVASLR